MILLEYAFNKKDFGPQKHKISVNEPNFSFSSKVMDLRERVLCHFKEIENEKTKRLTLAQWADLASNLWVFCEEFSGLFKYSDLKEKQMDKSLEEIINGLTSKHYSDQKQ